MVSMNRIMTPAGDSQIKKKKVIWCSGNERYKIFNRFKPTLHRSSILEMNDVYHDSCMRFLFIRLFSGDERQCTSINSNQTNNECSRPGLLLY